MSNLHDDCFAYKSRRKYPVHTKQATLKSYSQYLDQMQNISDQHCASINQNFVKAAKLHDIKLDSPIKPEVTRQTQVFTDSDGITVTFTKLATIGDVQKLNAMLDTHRANLSFDALQKIALMGFTTGQTLGVSQKVLTSLQKKAALGIGDKQQMLNQFLKRASMLVLPLAQQQSFYRLYNSMDKQTQQDMMTKSAQMYRAIHDIDRLYNLTSQYGKSLKAPQDVCCSTTTDTLLKEASDFLHVASTDTVLSKSALLQQKQKIQEFLKESYNYQAANQDELLNKVASLSKSAIESLVYNLEQ